MKSKLFLKKNTILAICTFVVLLAITTGFVKLFQYMTCEIKYTIFDQLDHNNEVLIKFPPAEKLQFVITGENLLSIDTINFEISSHNKKAKLISNNFERAGNKIILKPVILSADRYISDSHMSTEKNALPISLFKKDGLRYTLKLSYKTTDNNKIKATLFMTGRIKLHNYSAGFNPLDIPSAVKSHLKNDKNSAKHLETNKKATLVIQNTYRRSTHEQIHSNKKTPKLPGDDAKKNSKNKIDQENKELIKMYTETAERDPKDPMTYFEFGRIKCLLGQSEEAIKDFNKGLKLDPKCAWLYAARGEAKYNLKQYKAAIKDYSIALKLDPKYAYAYCGRGISKSALKQYKEAIIDFDKAIKLCPDDKKRFTRKSLAKAYLHRGYAKLKIARHKAAIRDYDKVIELDPKNSEAYCQRGWVKMMLAMWEASESDNAIAVDYTEALKDSNVAIKLDPKNSLAYTLRGTIYFFLHQYKKAHPDLLKANKLTKEQKKATLLKIVERKLQELNEAEKKAKKQEKYL